MVFLSNTSYAVAVEDYSLGKALLKFIFYIIIIFIVLIVAIYGTRFIAKNSKRFIGSKYIIIVDSLNLGVNFKVLIVEINNNIYILAITSNNVEVIDRISIDEFENNMNFDEHLQKHRYNYNKNNDYFKKIQSNIKKIFKKPNKDIDKEEEYNEKDN